jgi:hypothetical protein
MSASQLCNGAVAMPWLAAGPNISLLWLEVTHNKQKRLQEFTRQTDEHHCSVFNADSMNLWVSFYCDFYGAIMLVAVCIFAVSEKERGAPKVGLAFSNTIQLLVFYTWTLRLVTEAISLSASTEQLAWLANFTPIDGKDDINNAGCKLESARQVA